MTLSFSGNKICIVANRSKTWFYDALVKKMGMRPGDIYWIVTGQSWLKVLREAGYPKENIFYYEVLRKEPEADLYWLGQLERSMPMPLWRLIGTDRFLSKRTDHPDYFLSRVGQSIETFLINNDIQYCFGEATWSVELLTFYISKRASIKYLIPHTIRIPSERFAFFTDPFQAEFLQPDQNQHDWERNYHDMVESMLNDAKIPKPNYWYINNKVPAVRLDYITKSFKFLSEELFYHARSEYMDFSLVERIKNKLRMIRYKRQIAGLPFEKNFNRPDKKQYALFTLHKQPEASIDVMGGIYANQLSLIEVLSKTLPINYTLLVKEHSNAIGDRGGNFYNTVLNLGNTRLVDPWVNSHDLLKQVDVVFSVSGTVGMEASLLGKKAVMFCPVFFTKMPNVYFVDNLSSIKEVIDKPLVELRPYILSFYETLIRNSFDGLIGDPVCLPEAMTEENMELVSSAFEKVLSSKISEKVASG